MHRVVRPLLLLAVLLAAPLHAEDPAARAIVLANADDEDSVRIARHYAEVRGVPAANVVALPMSRAETITWAEFVQSVWEPLQQTLVRARWIDAIPMKLVDPAGRTKHAFSGHRIACLVVCRGVPLRIAHEAALYTATPPLTDNPGFRTNAAAVDSELSLLAHATYPVNAFVWNPLFADDRPLASERGEIIAVSRLDGPTVGDALQLVDRAVEAERRGLIGRAYVDLGGNHPDGDRWLQAAARQLGELGFDVQTNAASVTFPAGARLDQPALYLGWYTSRLNGPFALPGFRFPAGAIALHIHSYSAQTLRSTEDGWTGPLVSRGATATVGNVFEPFLQLTHRPDLLVRALARGATWGEAVLYAQPAVSWQTVAIGDPLYRPFGVAVDAQWSNRSRLTPEELGYVVIRRMNHLESARKPAEALALGRQVQVDRPSLALGVALATRIGIDDPRAAAGQLAGLAADGTLLRPDQWALAVEAASILVRGGRAPEALAWMHAVLEAARLPAELRRQWLPEGVRCAAAAGESAQVEQWQQQWAALSAAKAAEPR